MKSATLPSFWVAYEALDEHTKRAARKAFLLWTENPFHPSLRLKCVNHREDVWSLRVSLRCRALGRLDGDTITWFWIGLHDEYERHI